MRRWITPLVVVGVVTLGLLAAADALRRGGESKVVSEATTTTRTSPPTLRETLRREAVTGFVLYSDQDCRLHSLLLPTLEEDLVRGLDGAPMVECRFELDGGRVLPEGQLMSPAREVIAACRGDHVEVWIAESGRQLYSFRGCPPAWRPDDGALTYPRGDVIMEEGRVLFTAPELRAAARSHSNLQGFSGRIFVHATDLAWLDQDRLIVSLEARARFVEPQYLTVILQGNALVGAASRFGQPSGKWFVSPAHNYAAAEDGTMVTREGDFRDPTDNLPTGRAVAFSPDEQWLAYTTGISIYLIGTPRNSEPGRIIQLPIAAQDLVWEPVSRGTAVGPPIRR